MDTKYNHGWSTTEIDEHESSRFSWNTFLFAIAMTLIIVNWGFLRPASRQLETMKRQVYSLEKTIAKLSQQHGAAYKSMNLLVVV